MGLINWIFDFYQQHRIEQLQRDSMQARIDAASLRSPGGDIDVARLEQAVGELALSVKTLQRILVDHGVCTADELRQKLAQIDLEDGKADGRAPLP